MFQWVCRAALLLLSGLVAAPALGAAVLQCVPYARIVSGVELYGDALHWWDQAADRFKRGDKPKKGAVLAFRPHGPMTLGHVAVVSKILDDRRILIRHANWSVPGAIEEDVLALDVSQRGDWSAVRVWFSPNDQMGARTNPTFGFIYPAKAKLRKFEPDERLGASIDAGRWDEEELPRQMRAPERRAESLRPEPSRRAPDSGPKPTMTMVAQAHESGSGHAAPATRRAARDPFVVEYADASAARRPGSARSLGDIIADVKRDARLR